MGKAVQWGIIGLGDVARSFAAHFPTPHARLVAVASRNLQKANQFAAEFGSKKAYGHYGLLLRDPEVQAVYISTPNHRHHKDILNCLEQGKHIFCEKPISLNRNDLIEAKRLAAEKNVWLAEAMTIYHMPIYDRIDQMIAERNLGKIKMILASFGSSKETDPNNRFFNKDLGGGALFDIGVYALAFIRRYFSNTGVNIQSFSNLYKTGVDEDAVIQLRNNTGQLASAAISFRADIPRTGLIICERGNITVPNFPRAERAVFSYPDGTSEELRSGETKLAFQYEIERFSQNILSGSGPAFLSHTTDVTEWMDELAQQWGLKF